MLDESVIWKLDALSLSRLQFALTIGSHFLFPPLSIGLDRLIVIMGWRGCTCSPAMIASDEFTGTLSARSGKATKSGC